MNPKKVILFVNIILTGLVIWMASNVVLFWSSSRAKESPSPEAGRIQSGLPGKNLSRPRLLKDYEPLIRHDIFSVKQGSTKAPAKRQEIVVTYLDLTLKGTAVGKDHDSYAIILDNKTKKEDLYYANTVIRDARINKIEQDRVILEVNGREEALIISEDRRASNRPRAAPVRSSHTLSRFRNIRPPGATRPTIRRAPRREIPDRRGRRQGVRLMGNTQQPGHEMP